MKNFNKKSKWLLIVLLSIMVVIIVPYLINRLLYLSIYTNNTTDSDWLSFWGSFLGGIFGGVATLMGVVYTLKSSERQRREDRKVELIPKENIVEIISNYKGEDDASFFIYNVESKYNCKDKESVDLKDGTESINDLLHMEILNASKEIALDLEITWEEVSEKDLNKCTSLQFYEKDIYQDVFFMNDNVLLKELSEKDKITINYIMGYGNEKVMMPWFYQEYLRGIIINLLKINDMSVLKKNIPLGKIKIKSRNTYGEPSENDYEVVGMLANKGLSKGRYILFLQFVLLRE